VNRSEPQGHRVTQMIKHTLRAIAAHLLVGLVFAIMGCEMILDWLWRRTHPEETR